MSSLQCPFSAARKVPQKVSNVHRNLGGRINSIFVSRNGCRIYRNLKYNTAKPYKTMGVIPFKKKVDGARTITGAAGINDSIAKMPETVPRDGIGIENFLQGKTYLITGATGLVGKALIEKILRAGPNVNKIYVLIKAENKEAATKRLKDEIIETNLFDSLRRIHGRSYQAFMFNKVIPIVGNVSESKLGMDAMEEIIEDVDVIINSAANTTLDERYDFLLETNTRGPFRLLNLAKKCKHLRLFVHVSSTYVNGEREGTIKEKPFDLGESIVWEKAITSGIDLPTSIPELNPDSELELAMEWKKAFENKGGGSQKIRELGSERAKSYGWRNTYELTKAMGEMLICSMRGDVPLVIIRPSIIVSTYREPFPGWIQGNRTLDPLVIAYGKGQLPGLFANPETLLDLIPVDLVVNAIITVMAKHGTTTRPDVKVYHVASSVANPLTTYDVFKFTLEHFTSSPFFSSQGKGIDIAEMKYFNSMDEYSSFIQTDVVRQSRLSMALTSSDEHKLSKRLEKNCQRIASHAISIAKLYESYTFYGGRFDNGNTQELMQAMSKEEKRSFDFDVGNVNWKDYLSNIHIPGLRLHVLKGRGKA